MKVEINLCH
jgi:hypothetical protein